MFTVEVEDREMGVKPMNCPGHAHLFGSSRHSYRDLPVRYFEPGLLHRNEPSGVLHGLLRVRHFAQDDGHIFCTEEQVEDEVRGCLEMAFDTYALFGFEISIELSTRPEERVGTDEMWDRAELKLTRTLEALGLDYELNPGDGAFYGPKIDMHMTDSLGRSWQLGTVQLDYSMPARFELSYTGTDNQEHTPVMIHRAMFGSYERFIGVMLEHYAGELPLWLAPVQAIVLPVSDRFQRLCRLGQRRPARRGHAHRARRSQRVDRTQDPRGRAAQDPVHAGRGGARAGRRHGGRARAPRRRSGQHFRPGVRRAPGGRAILLGIEASEILRAPRLAFT